MIVTIMDYERLKNTVNGGPRYKIVYEKEDGTSETGYTQSDTTFSYAISLKEKEKYKIKTHKTKTKIIIDNMELIK